jgi:hypothetical protein
MRLCLGLLVLSQFAMAAHACSSLVGSPASAFTQAERHPCHENNEVNPGACRMHCLQGDQAPVPQEFAPVSHVPQPLSFEISLDANWIPLAHRPVVLAVNSDPPLPIRYCRFLN